MEKFAIPGVGAIIEKVIDDTKYILIQERQKEDESTDNGMLEIPAGKIREYENIYTTLRREIMEETGLTVTKIHGEELTVESTIRGNRVISFTPFHVTQNLSGAYSIILNTFLCIAEGELKTKTNETQNIRWEKVEDIKEMLIKNPNQFFLMHVNALNKYLQL